MKSIIKLFLVLLIFTNLYSKEEDYYEFEEYLKLFNQVSIYNKFKQVVEEDAKAIKTNNDKIKIVMIYPANQISDYWRKSKISLKKD